MKTADVPGDRGTKPIGDEAGQRFEFFRPVVEARHDQGGDLDKNAECMHPLQRVQHRTKARTALLLVVVVAEGFQVDIGPVQAGGDHLDRLRAHVAVGHKNIFQPAPLCQPGGVVRKFEEDGGLGVGVGNASAAGLARGRNHLRGGGLIAQNHALAVGRHLGDIRILAEPAAEIAAHGGNRIGSAAGHEMIERLFFDGVHVAGDQFAVHPCVQGPVPVFAHGAQTAPAGLDQAAVSAQPAANVFVFRRFPEIGFHINQYTYSTACRKVRLRDDRAPRARSGRILPAGRAF